MWLGRCMLGWSGHIFLLILLSLNFQNRIKRRRVVSIHDIIVILEFAESPWILSPCIFFTLLNIIIFGVETFSPLQWVSTINGIIRYRVGNPNSYLTSLYDGSSVFGGAHTYMELITNSPFLYHVTFAAISSSGFWMSLDVKSSSILFNWVRLTPDFRRWAIIKSIYPLMFFVTVFQSFIVIGYIQFHT